MPLPDAMGSDDSLAMLLRAVDHPVPTISIDTIMSRARRRTRWHAWLGAAAVLFAAGAAAAAVSPSTVVRYVRAVLAHQRAEIAGIARRPAVSSATARRPAQAVRGVSFVPGNRVDIAFRDRQATGVLRVRIADVPSVQLSHDSSVAAYTLTATGVMVDNAGSSASYELVIPRNVARARVVVGARTVLIKEADRVTSTGIRDTAGDYVIAILNTDPGRP